VTFSTVKRFQNMPVPREIALVCDAELYVLGCIGGFEAQGLGGAATLGASGGPYVTLYCAATGTGAGAGAGAGERSAGGSQL
jgi:hypothetical protein